MEYKPAVENMLARIKDAQKSDDAQRYTQAFLNLMHGLQIAESIGSMGRECCPNCYRFKARSAQDAAKGDCSKWYATHDREAEKDCQDFREKTGYWARPGGWKK